MPHGIHGLSALSSKRGGVVFTFWEAMLMMSAGVAARACVIRRAAHRPVAALARGLRGSLGRDLRKLNVACAIIVVLTLGFAGCSNGSTTPQVNTTPSWGFPFKTGTQVTLGDLGLHDDNFNSVPGKNSTITLRGAGDNPNAPTNPGVPDASLDLLPAQPNTPVIPVGAGTILSVWPLCHLVLIDLGNNTWVEYLHVKVDPALSIGASVTRDTLLGTTTTEITTDPNTCNEHFEGSAPVDHVHFAFLQGSGTTGTFVSMVGKMLCGHTVKTSPATNGAPDGGAIDGLADAPNKTFTVPDCPSPPTSSAATVTSRPTFQGTIREFPIPPDDKSLQYGSSPAGITTGPDGALWFAEANGDRIGRITTSGAITEFNTPPSNGGGGPVSITSGPDGALWFTGEGVDRIVRITTTGAITQFTIDDNGYDEIAQGPDGALWFTEAHTNQIGRISTAGAITKFSLPEGGTFTGLTGITDGPDGAIWFTERENSSGNKIGRITTEGTVTEFPIPTADSFANYIAAGPDGALWFTEYKGDKIGRITTSGSITEFGLQQGSAPEGITASPDGALWFTESGRNKIGRITTTGTITEVALPAPVQTSRGYGRSPFDITVGPDGKLWFTEFVGDNIGRLT